jgi:hypothetical protein
MGGFQAVVGLTMWRRQANSAMTRANFGFGRPGIKATPGKRADESAHWTRSSSLSPSIASNFSWQASRTPHQINGTRAMNLIFLVRSAAFAVSASASTLSCSNKT